MFTESAELYDLIYSFKNYGEESARLAEVIRGRRPGCRTVLDVACGTGEHHRYLKAHFNIDGLDLDEKLMAHARPKNPAGTYTVADMSRFSLDKKYDVVTCLFSSIAYLETYSDIVSALSCFRDHLEPGGLILLEPWFTQESWNKGRVHMLTQDKDQMKVCRISNTRREGDYSILQFHYMVGTPENVQYFEERHRLLLTSRTEMMQAFDEAGLEAEYEETGLAGRGMYYAVKKST